MAADLTNALPDLGRRVERLLYFGSILLLLCCLELYFVSAAVYVKTENPKDIAALIVTIEGELPRLERLFSKVPDVVSKKAKTDLDRRVNETRRQLGLPPQQEEIKSAEESYAMVLEKILADSPSRQRLSPTTLNIVRNDKEPPKVKVEALQRLRRDLIAQPVTIWGIVTPLVLSMDYGGGQYQIPAEFIATSLFFALAPLLIAWLGSLFVTRQRELMIIRNLTDYRLAFPHVLNIVSVNYSNFEPFSSMSPRVKKSMKRNDTLNQVVTSFVRSMILLGFAFPMCGILSYSAIELFVNPRDFFSLFGGLCFAFWLAYLALSLIGQEWLLLWKKEFYA